MSLLSCGAGGDENVTAVQVNVPDTAAPVAVARVDRLLAEYPRLDPQARAAAVDSMAPQLATLMRVYGADGLDPEALDQLSRMPMVAAFQPEADSVFPTLEALERDLGNILANSRSAGIPVTASRFGAVVWGKPQPVIRDSDVVLVALNHFLGADHPAYSHLEPYKRILKTPGALPSELARALVCTQYPMQETGETTLLSWMLYEGAATEAVLRLLPGADTATVMGMLPEQYAYARDNIRPMYDDMAAKQVLYEKSPTVIDRYIGPAPSTPLLGGTAPGRAGRLVGHSIVKAYLDSHPGDSALRVVLSPQFYNSRRALIDSGF